VVRAFKVHPASKRLAQLAQAFADAELFIPIGGRFPLADAREAHRLAESGASGKVLLTS
jgi:NADPH:quinone reductase-like Zn-dependent oxidoreductase